MDYKCNSDASIVVSCITSEQMTSNISKVCRKDDQIISAVSWTG